MPQLKNLGIINLSQLRELIISFYYYNEIRLNRGLTRDEATRPMFCIKLCDNYADANTFIFSVQGSPPKGRAVYLQRRTWGGEEGTLILFGMESRQTSVKISLDWDRTHAEYVEFAAFFGPSWIKEEALNNGKR